MMTPIPVHIISIYQRSLEGEITTIERAQLDEFFRKSTTSEIEFLISTFLDTERSQPVVEEDSRLENVGASLRSHVGHVQQKRLRLHPALIAVAAALALALCMWLIVSRERAALKSTANILATVSLPGGSRAERSVRSGNVTINVPNGSQYKAVLPDGSSIMLNAGSRVTFPEKFTGKLRSVSLSGEGYFIVAKDHNHPFVVSTRDQKVTVLGTQFNVRSYPSEARTVTTLEEGRVSVTGKNGKMVMLLPGQQALTSAGQISSQPAEVGQTLYWTDRRLNFTDAPVADVLASAERWYNVQMRYEGDSTAELYNGELRRDASLASFLTIMKANGYGYREHDGTLIIFRLN